MSDLRDSLGSCGFDPSYEDITVEAMKRGRNGDGRQFEVDVTTRAGRHLGVVCLRGGELDDIGKTVDAAVDYEVGVETLGQRVADLLVNKVAALRAQGGSDDHQIYTRI